MTHLLSRRWMIVMFILCTLPALSACGSGDVGGTPAVTPAANTPAVTAAASRPAVTPAGSTPVVTSAASTPAATPAGSLPAATPAVGTPAAISGTLSAEVVFGSGPFNFPETKTGLSDLSSYKATLTLSFDGTRDGKTQQWSKTYVMLTARKPAARQLTIEKAGALSDLDPVFMAEADGAAYERRGKRTCTASVIDPGNSLADRMEPAGFLTGVIGAEEAGGETVNGAAAKHYTFDERAFGQLGLAKSTGEMWVASDGGYIVKYLLTTKGTAVYFGEGIEGTLSWDYELTGVNQPVAIQLPADCPAGMVDAPLLPDATGVLRLPGLLSYSTLTSLANAAAFYQKQIPLLGWKPLGNPTITDTLALLDYTQGAKTMTVIITGGQAGTAIRIVVGAGQP
jgi:hypothetical protein